MLDIKVPTIGESISEATLAKWLKKDGDYVERDEVICELESEKATFELNAEQAGTLKREWARKGRTLTLTDMMIAATAMEHGLRLVTDNRKDFPMDEIAFYPLP